MANSDGILAGLAAFLARLEKERDETSQKLTELDEHIKSVATTFRLIRHDGKLAEPDTYDALVTKLRKERTEGKITQAQALETIASTIGDNGTFKVQAAKKVMLGAGVIANAKNADSVIYSLIDRSGKYEKVNPGKYKLVSASRVYKFDRAEKRTKGTRGHSEVSGVMNTIKVLKEANPSLTQAEAFKTLIHDGFDFRGKKPGNAVNMAWVRLGYAKEKVQQRLIPQEALMSNVATMNCPACHRYTGLPNDVANHIRAIWDEQHTTWLEHEEFNPVGLLKEGNWVPVIQHLERMTNK